MVTLRHGPRREKQFYSHSAGHIATCGASLVLLKEFLRNFFETLSTLLPLCETKRYFHDETVGALVRARLPFTYMVIAEYKGRVAARTKTFSRKRVRHLLQSVLILLCVKLTFIHRKAVTQYSPATADVKVDTQVEQPKLASSNSIFLIGVFSTFDGHIERDRVRHSIFPEENPRICTLNELVAESRTLARRPASCQLAYTFVLGGNPRGQTFMSAGQGPLSMHATGNNELDLTILNIRENMNDGKTLTWFNYAASLLDFLSIDYVAKMDCDTYLNTDLFLDFIHRDLKYEPSGQRPRRIYGGILNEAISCGLLSGNKVCELLKSRVYMSGQFYFVSADLARYVSKYGSERFEQRVGVEDIDFGVWVQSHPQALHLIVMTGEVMWYHSLQTKSTHGWNALRDGKAIFRLPARHDNLIWLDDCLRRDRSSCLRRRRIFPFRW